MGPDLTSLPRTTACPACGAALRPEATWCSLCFYDFRAATAPPARPAPGAAPDGQSPSYGTVADPLTAPLLDLLMPAPVVDAPAPAPEPAPAPSVAPAATPSWPCARCGALNGFEEMVCLGCGSGFLAHVSERPRLELPYLGDLYALSRGQRVFLAATVASVVALLLPLVASVF